MANDGSFRYNYVETSIEEWDSATTGAIGKRLMGGLVLRFALAS